VLDPHLAAAVHQAKHGIVFQVEPVSDLMCGNYDAVTTVGESFTGTRLGLGVTEACDGEIVSVDGHTWRIPETGVAEPAPADLGVAFAVAARAGRSVDLPIDAPTSFAALTRSIEEMLHVDHCGVAAVRVDGDFTDVLLRSEARQSEPYRPLAEVLMGEVRFTFSAWSGTMVGFLFPDTNPDSVIPALHLHAISADRSTGGHCHEATVQRGVVRVWLDDAEIGASHQGAPVSP
jgi:acetolactate decarboxylase